MPNEYWLQKKTLGGWSVVTWYNDLAQAQENYERCKANGVGYSWRLVKVETLEQKLLDEVTEVEAPELEPQKIKNYKINEPMSINVHGELGITSLQPKSAWSNKPKIGWGDIPSSSVVEHGMSGKVWLIHHGLKLKKRVDPGEVDAMMAQGYERGGPKTAFRE